MRHTSPLPQVEALEQRQFFDVVGPLGGSHARTVLAVELVPAGPIGEGVVEVAALNLPNGKTMYPVDPLSPGDPYRPSPALAGLLKSVVAGL